MDSISSLSSAQTIIIRAALSMSPHIPCSFFQSKFMNSFTKTVQVLRWEIKVHLDKLVHENKTAVICVKILVSFSKRIRKLKIECSSLCHPKPNHFKSNIWIIVCIMPFNSIIRNTVSLRLFFDLQKTNSSVNLWKTKVEESNKFVVDSSWDGFRVNSKCAFT